jgi:hypothetical protein
LWCAPSAVPGTSLAFDAHLTLRQGRLIAI